MILDEVASYLVTAGAAVSGSTASWCVAKGYEPESPDRVITLLESGGLPNDADPAGSLDRPTLQVRVRGPGMATAAAYQVTRQKAAEVRLALDAVNNEAVGGWPYVHIRVMHEPLSLGVDDANRPTLVLNCWAVRSRTS